MYLGLVSRGGKSSLIRRRRFGSERWAGPWKELGAVLGLGKVRFVLSFNVSFAYQLGWVALKSMLMT